MCKDLIILLMGHINFIRDLVGETSTLGGQFRPNWED